MEWVDRDDAYSILSNIVNRIQTDLYEVSGMTEIQHRALDSLSGGDSFGFDNHGLSKKQKMIHTRTAKALHRKGFVNMDNNDRVKINDYGRQKLKTLNNCVEIIRTWKAQVEGING